MEPTNKKTTLEKCAIKKLKKNNFTSVRKKIIFGQIPAFPEFFRKILDFVRSKKLFNKKKL